MSVTTRTFVFAGYCLVLCLAHWAVLAELLMLSRTDSSASHLLLVPLVTIVLVYHVRKTTFATVGFAAAGVGVIAAGIALSLGASVFGWAAQEDGLTWRIAALVVLALGGFLLLYGHEAFRAARFPLLFLAFMIPLPTSLLEAATQFLKSGTADTVAALFSFTGTPYHRREFVFQLPGIVIEIADACSGIRSSIALVLTSLLVGYTYLRSPWKRLLLTLAVVPLTILKNAIRIVTLSLLTIHADRGFLDSSLHHDGGVVFFLLSLVILLPLLLWLRYSEARLQTQRI
jgi:exosortase